MITSIIFMEFVIGIHQKELPYQDYTMLTDIGLQPRYNTSIPKILHNIYNYYKPQGGSGHALLIYMGQVKTHLVLVQGYQLVESRDFSIGLDHFMDPLCKMVLEVDGTEDEIRNMALDFLDRYGVALPETKPSELDIFPWDEAHDYYSCLTHRSPSPAPVLQSARSASSSRAQLDSLASTPPAS